ncbi:MAG: glycosyltransferase family 4 protein [Deltaproteobacteria bacterium]|nr:glycosyltransferase family 4 protein [Deltaproteobacteria bacterium]
MRVLVYTHEFPPFLGGLATSSFKLVKGISEAGLEVAALVPGYSSEDKEIDKTLSSKIIRIPFLGKSLVKKLPFIEYFWGWIFFSLTIAKEKPDIVLFITEEAEAVGGLFPFFSFKPIARVAGSGITTCFFSKKINKRLLQFPIRRLYANSTKIIAVSHSTRELLERIGIPRDKITVIYSGVESYMVYQKPNDKNLERLRNKLGIGERDKILLTVARVLPRKGQDMVIRALPKVIAKYPHLKYLVVGEGRYKAIFRKLAEEEKVGDNVIFTGGVPHEKTIDFYDLCDVFIMPNRPWNNKVEGLPNAFLEASARGKPAIAGDHGGSKEAIQHGLTGYLVNPESIDEIADAILVLLSDEEKARNMGENAKLMVEKSFTEEKMIKNYLKVIKSLTEEDPPARIII